MADRRKPPDNWGRDDRLHTYKKNTDDFHKIVGSGFYPVFASGFMVGSGESQPGYTTLNGYTTNFLEQVVVHIVLLLNTFPRHLINVHCITLVHKTNQLLHTE